MRSAWRSSPKWPGRIGRTENVRVLDQTGSLALLEENLTRVSLYHYQNLYEPAFDLVHVLRAISRCKDELVSPADYRAAAVATKEAAVTDEDHEKADKALEVAGVYEVYEELLVENDAVDFGDLVMLSRECWKSTMTSGRSTTRDSSMS